MKKKKKNVLNLFFYSPVLGHAPTFSNSHAHLIFFIAMLKTLQCFNIAMVMLKKGTKKERKKETKKGRKKERN